MALGKFCQNNEVNMPSFIPLWQSLPNGFGRRLKDSVTVQPMSALAPYLRPTLPVESRRFREIDWF